MSVTRQDLTLKSRWLPAAGALGFAIGKGWPLPDAPGAWVTPPVSLHARRAADNRALIPYPGGFLLHTGLPNPGLRDVLKEQAPRWARNDTPVWLHILAEEPETVSRMLRGLEALENLAAVELEIPPDASVEQALALVQAADTELPLVVEIPLTIAGDGWLKWLADLGVSALSLGAPRGCLPGADGALVRGRLYGPAIFPQALQALRSALPLGLPVIASGGVYNRAQGNLLLQVGALAVKLDAVLWRGWGEEESHREGAKDAK